MAFAVDQATPDDVAVLSMLIEEIETHYGATDIPSDAERQQMINHLLFGDVLIAWTLLARDADRVVGMASYSYHWLSTRCSSRSCSCVRPTDAAVWPTC
ncbi:hypothetical protein GCM10022226_78850 [Sphaerisporangium flaviroseum]|uniref:N-acetyltransferase domain-containing protein n=1 Tax=Sphaerisporangium flaviroseum TaxID=509199 RepID=A0ABP7JHY1_9ACTN